MFRTFVAGLVALGCLAWSEVPRARADNLGLSLGVVAKLGGGGNYLPPPSEKPPFAAPFDDGVGGYGIAGGVAVDVRLLRGLLGVETGFIVDALKNWSKYEPTGNAGPELSLGWSSTDLRVPLLLSVGTPGEGTRLSFGTGPEFVVPMGTDFELEIERAGFFQDAMYRYEVEAETHVNWLFNFGLASPVGPVRVTFDLRFALNLAVPDTYAERVFNGALVTQHSMDLRLLLGVGYDLL